MATLEAVEGDVAVPADLRLRATGGLAIRRDACTCGLCVARDGHIGPAGTVLVLAH
jgi:hypothetical protein